MSAITHMRSTYLTRIQLLVDALRSGEFQQHRGGLRGEGGYCCLGVATEVALRNGLVVSDDGSGNPWDQPYQVMCEPVAEWFGLSVNPRLINEDSGRRDTAAAWNDDLQVEFPEIADMFEYTYLRERRETAPL